jgi:hypothetical protein
MTLELLAGQDHSPGGLHARTQQLSHGVAFPRSRLGAGYAEEGSRSYRVRATDKDGRELAPITITRTSHRVVGLPSTASQRQEIELPDLFVPGLTWGKGKCRASIWQGTFCSGCPCTKVCGLGRHIYLHSQRSP